MRRLSKPIASRPREMVADTTLTAEQLLAEQRQLRDAFYAAHPEQRPDLPRGTTVPPRAVGSRGSTTTGPVAA